MARLLRGPDLRPAAAREWPAVRLRTARGRAFPPAWLHACVLAPVLPLRAWRRQGGAFRKAPCHSLRHLCRVARLPPRWLALPRVLAAPPPGGWCLRAPSLHAPAA